MNPSAILFVTSNSPPADISALTRAIKLSKKTDATLHCLCVFDEIKWSARISALLPRQNVVNATVSQRAESLLSAQIAAIDTQLPFSFAVRFGHVYLEAIRYCLQHPVDLIVKAAAEPSWADRLFDTEDMHLLRKSPVPVWITAPGEKPEIKSVVVAVDFEYQEKREKHNLNRKLLCRAIEIAQDEQATLHLINVYNVSNSDFVTLWADDPDKLEEELLQDEKITSQAAMKNLLEGVARDMDFEFNGLDYTIHLVQGNAKEAIAKTVKKLRAPLLIMGSVTRTGVAGLFIGSTAESTLLQIKCPVLVMKPDGFVTPVEA